MLTNIFLSILETSLSTSFVVAVLLLFSSFLNKRYAAKWNYWIWIFLALRLLIPFSGMSEALRDNSFGGATGMEWNVEKSGTENHRSDLSKEEMSPGRILIELPSQVTSPIGAQVQKNGLSVSLLDIAAAIWLAGSFLFLLIHLFSYFRYKNQILHNGKVIKDKCIRQQLLELEYELHVDMIPVWESSKAASPMILGFFQPILVLPKEQYEPKELYFILKHELIHLKRKDVLLKLLFVAANSVHWFNPLIWLMQKEAVIDMELSCDELVIQDADYAMRKAYTETLFSTLQKRYTKKAYLSTQFYGGKQIMKKRFKNILAKTEKKNGAALLLCAIALALALGTLIGCSAAKEDAEEEELSKKSQEEQTFVKPTDPSLEEIQPIDEPVADIPQTGQIYGYLTKFNEETITINRQLWATPESEEWNSEYNEDAGFEVVDTKEEDITYPIHKDCTYSVLENHQDPVIPLSKEEFLTYLQEMEYPILWVMELEEGQIKDIKEQYRP